MSHPAPVMEVLEEQRQQLPFHWKTLPRVFLTSLIPSGVSVYEGAHIITVLEPKWVRLVYGGNCRNPVRDFPLGWDQSSATGF